MGFTEVLTLIFIVLKLIGVITWSWWLVLLPEIIAVGIYLIILLVMLISEISTTRKVKKRFKNF